MAPSMVAMAVKYTAVVPNDFPVEAAIVQIAFTKIRIVLKISFNLSIFELKNQDIENYRYSDIIYSIVSSGPGTET